MFRHTTTIIFLLTITLLLGACAGRAPDITIPAEEPPPLVLKKPPRVALVLGAGGARGYAHAGAVYELQKAGIPIDLIVGSSAGAFYGALLADQGNADQAGQIMLSAKFWDIADIANVPSIQGAMAGYRYQKFLLKNMHARWFNQLKIPLIAVTTDLTTGEEFAISSGPVAPAAEASASIPGAVKPAHFYGRTLVDGGMIDPIPVDVAMRYQPKVIIAINIANPLSPKMPWSAVGIYERAFHISWLQLSRLSERNASYVIRPNVSDAGTFDIAKKQQLFEAGQLAADRALPAIKALLAARHIPLQRQP